MCETVVLYCVATERRGVLIITELHKTRLALLKCLPIMRNRRLSAAVEMNCSVFRFTTRRKAI